MGQTQFRRGKIAETATGKMTDLISINKLDANASKFERIEVDVDLFASEDFELVA